MMRDKTWTSRLLGVTAALTVLLGAEGASAGQFNGGPVPPNPPSCIQNLFGKKLNCTAEDVALARATNIVVADKCDFPGDTTTFTADFHVQANAQDRFDIGMYFAIDGDPNADGAYTGQCSINTMPSTTPDGDACGDVANKGEYIYTATITTSCVPTWVPEADSGNGGYRLLLPYCTSWRVQGNNDICSDPRQAFPSETSKCKCDQGYWIDIPVPPYGLKVTKTPSPATVNEPGANVTYTLVVSNPSPFLGVTLNSLVDSIYGDVANAANPALVSTTCSLPQSLTTGDGTVGGTDTYSCTFTAFAGGAPGALTDTVTATGVDARNRPATGSATATVTIADVGSQILVEKSASPFEVQEPGGMVTFSVLVKNQSAVDTVTIYTLTDVIQDSGAPASSLDGVGDCILPWTLRPGDQMSCAFTRIVAGNAGYAEIDEVEASGLDDDRVPVSDKDTATVTVKDVPSSIELTKLAVPDQQDEPGGDVVYTFRIVNRSAVDTVTITQLVDSYYGDLNGAGTCSVPASGIVLVPFAPYECSATFAFTGNAGSEITNKATASGYDDDQVPVSAEASESVQLINVLPKISVQKDAAPASVPESGGDVTYTVLVSNESTAESVRITSLADDRFGDLSTVCGLPWILPAKNLEGASRTCTFVRRVSGDFASGLPHTNTVTATGNDDDGSDPATASDSATVAFLDVLPNVLVTKVADPLVLAEPGGAFTFTITITNLSTEAATIAALTDTRPGLPAGCTDLVGTTLAAAASASCSYTVTFTDAGSYTNTAAATLADNDGNSASDDDTATVTVTDVKPTVDLTKDVAPTSIPEPGGDFSYTLTIHNTSVEEVTITALTDPNISAECSALVGTKLAAGATKSCGYVVSHRDTGTFPNTASVTVEDNEGNPASDSDSKSVSVTDVLPSVTVYKTVVGLGSLPEPGGAFTFTLQIQNTSVEPVTITSLTDTNTPTLSADCAALVGATLDVAESAFCTYSVTHTEAGQYDNTATVEVQDNEGNPASDTVTASVDVSDVSPTVFFTKSATPSVLPEPGGVFTFTLTIRNGSPEAVTITALSDTNPLPLACTGLIGTSIPAGGTVECSYPVTHTEAGTYSNTASVEVTDNEGNTEPASDDETVTVTDVLPTVDLVKTVTPASLDEPGGAFAYTLTIHNTSVEAVKISALTDTNTLPAECLALIGTTIPVGSFVSCAYAVTHTEAGSYPNTASVEVRDNESNPASDTDSKTVTVVDAMPSVDLTKTVTPESRDEPGGAFEYTVTIKNNSVENVTVMDFSDQDGQACAFIGNVLVPGEVATCTYSVTHTEAGSYPNTASVTVQDNESNTASDSDSKTVKVNDVLPRIELTKSVTPLTRDEPGGAFGYTLTIRNPSVEEVTITALTDDNALSPECTALVGTKIAAGGTASCLYTVVHTEAGVYPNTARVTVKDNENNPASAQDGKSVTVNDVPPSVALDKSVNVSTLPEPGGVFTYTLKITNTSLVEPATITALTDTNTLSAECTALIGTTLAPGGSTSCTYTKSYTEAGSYPNTATVTVRDNELGTASATDTETVTITDVAPSLTVVKDNDANVDQSFNDTETAPYEGSSVTYRVTITNTGVEAFTIKSVVDSPFGPQCASLVGTSVGVGRSVTCTFSKPSPIDSSNPSAQEQVFLTDTITVSVEDNEKTPASGSDTSTVWSPKRGKLEVTKWTQGAVDATKTWTFNLYAGPDGFGTAVLAGAGTLNDVDGKLLFSEVLPYLDPNKTFTICEISVPAGWTSMWQLGGPTGPTVIPYNPNADDAVPQDLGNRCVDIGKGQVYPIPSGGILAFHVNNTYPGGEPRSPGYWKNWNRCTGGGQAAVADRNGPAPGLGYKNGYWLLENALDVNITKGITWDDMQVDNILFPITTCQVAVDILDQRDIGNATVIGDGKKMASDAAYTLAMHLLSAQLNLVVGAKSCPAVLDAVVAGENLLDTVNFVGTGSYITAKSKYYAQALSLAATLDKYNNGKLCP